MSRNQLPRFFISLFRKLPGLSMWLAASCIALAGMARAEEAPRPASGDAVLQATRMVLGIISYARWPVPPESYRVCAAGDLSHLRELLEKPASVRERPVVAKVLEGGIAQSASVCNVLYLGETSASRRKQLLGEATGRQILTIVEADDACASGGMFCLGFQADGVILQTNLDAISRSGIQINPQVLKLTRRKPVQP